MSLLCTVALLAGIQCGAPPLCIHGHPAPRRLGVTYAGLRPKHGYQRDHYVSLGLGGADDASNVHYQQCQITGARGKCMSGPAKLKDDDEWSAEEAMCAGRMTQTAAVQWLTDRWPIDAEHGYDLER